MKNDFKHGKRPPKYFDIDKLITTIKNHNFILVSEDEFNKLKGNLNGLERSDNDGQRKSRTD